MRINQQKTKLHPMCRKCVHRQPIKQDGRLLDSSAFKVVWEKYKIKDRKGEIRTVLFGKLILKKGKDTIFQRPVAACWGLNVVELEAQGYPFLECPPCYYEGEKK